MLFFKYKSYDLCKLVKYKYCFWLKIDMILFLCNLMFCILLALRPCIRDSRWQIPGFWTTFSLIKRLLSHSRSKLSNWKCHWRRQLKTRPVSFTGIVWKSRNRLCLTWKLSCSPHLETIMLAPYNITFTGQPDYINVVIGPYHFFYQFITL